MDFKMKIDFDEKDNEFFLKFVDEHDIKKKSNFLKLLKEHNIDVVTMTINENDKKQTESQQGMFKAFLIILNQYTGYSESEIKDSIYSELKITKDEISAYTRDQYTEFIEKLFHYCSHNVGINLEVQNGKLKIVQDE